MIIKEFIQHDLDNSSLYSLRSFGYSEVFTDPDERGYLFLVF